MSGDDGRGVRVLVCAQGFPRHPGDHRAPFLLDHARALSAAGARVTVLCPSAPGLVSRETWDDIDVVRFRYAPRRLETLAYGGAMHRRVRGPSALLLPFFFVGFLIAALRHGRHADVIHGHWWIPSGMVAVVSGHLLGVASVVHVHGTDAALARGPMRILARRVLRSADGVLVASRSLGEWARGLGRTDVTVAPMPLAVDRLPPAGPPDPTGPLLAVGRLVPEKGFDVLIEAAARVRMPLVLVGAGDERPRLEALSAAHGASVRFEGTLAPGDLAARYAGARLVVVPSRREGFGMVAAEAAAAGRAVVASNVGGLPDIVEDGKNGTLVPPGDVAALSVALEGTDPGLGAAGPDAVAWLHPEAIAARNLAVYQSVRARPHHAWGPTIVRWTGGVVAVIAVAMAVRAVSDQWARARTVHVDWSPGPVSAAIASVVLADLAIAALWGRLVRRGGSPVAARTAMRVWWTGQLGRYLPTGLGSVPARVVVGAREGIGRRLSLVTTGAEVAAMVIVTAIAAVALAPTPWSVMAAALALAVGATSFGHVTALAARRVDPSTHLSARPAAGFLVGHQAVFLVRAFGFWALLHVVSAHTVPSIAHTAGAVGLAYFLGTVAVFSPGGVGVREAVLVGLLSSSTGAQAALAAAVSWRLLELVVELAILAWARTLRTATVGVGASGSGG